jgi:hypothetical protein
MAHSLRAPRVGPYLCMHTHRSAVHNHRAAPFSRNQNPGRADPRGPRSHHIANLSKRIHD